MEKQLNNPPVGKNESGGENKQSKKTLFIVFGIVAGFFLLCFVVLVIGGIFWLKSYQTKLENEFQKNLAEIQNYSSANLSSELDSLTADTSETSSFSSNQNKIKSSRYPADPSYLERSIYYWNCKYHYSLNYPQNWSIDDQSHNALQVFFQGSGVTLKIESIGLLPGETLRELADRRNEPGKISADTAGINVWSEEINWDGVSVIETDYVKPDAIVIHWLEGGRGMELMIFGTGFNNQFLEIEKMLATLDVGLVNMSACQVPETTSPVTVPKSSTKENSFNCDSWIHPNGDIEYWWDSISPQEKDCYVSKYGAPPFYEP